MDSKQLLLSLALLAASATVSANLVVNGDFETPPLDNPGSITGWVLTGSGIQQSATGASFDSTAAYFDYNASASGTDSISQTLTTLTSSTYSLSADVYVQVGDTITIDFGSYSHTFTALSTVGWQHFTVSGLAAAASSTALTINTVNGGVFDYVDNVVVVADSSPAPASESGTLALMALGLGALGFARRRQA